METPLEMLVRRYQEPVHWEYAEKRVLMDFTVTHTWLRQGIMIGIARTCNELYIALRKILPVVLVEISMVNGRPEIHQIDINTLTATKEIIQPQKGDILFTPEFQLLGIQVPMNHPPVSFFAQFGVERIAVIYDLLPIIHPKFFEPDTVKRMPDYVVNILKNYDRIICISKTVCESVCSYVKDGVLAPLDLDIRFSSYEQAAPYLTSGWYPIEAEGVWGTNEAELSFYVANTQTDLWVEIEGEVFCGAKNTTILINDHELIVLRKGEETNCWKGIVPLDFLDSGGLQQIKFKTEGARAPLAFGFSQDNRVLGYFVKRLHITAVEQDPVPVRSIMTHPVEVDYIYLGATKLRSSDTSLPDPLIIEFMKTIFPVFLMVGTIEPRKGYEIILLAFERLWSSGFQGKLCIIGRAGWGMEKMLSLLRNHPRQGRDILFLEAASDSTLDYAYRHATAIIQASADEGYGLPLIEAGQYGTPVLCSDIPVFREVGKDSVLYFNRNSLHDIEIKIRNFTTDKRMGKIPDSRKISTQTWEDCAHMCLAFFQGIREWMYRVEPEKLLDGNAEIRQPKRKKAMLATTFPIFPPDGGGKARSFGLYKNLAKEIEVEIVALGANCDNKRKKTICSGLIEKVIPKSNQHESQEQMLEKQMGIPITDIGMMLYGNLTPEYQKELERVSNEANYLIVCHPYSYPWIKQLGLDKPIIYDAQDVEYLIKKQMLKNNTNTTKVLNTLLETEKVCCMESQLILTCSEEDKEALASLYDVERDKIIVVPNGVDCKEIQYVSWEERQKLKKEAGLEGERLAIFMGSWHGPNLEAAEKVIALAHRCRQVRFMLLGSQCSYFEHRVLPENVGLLGLVTEEEKQRIFHLTDYALNPMESGSGTNLKMFDYMASGLPIITTEFGARGIEDKTLFCISDVNHMDEALYKLDSATCERMAHNARIYVERHFDWPIIAHHMWQRMKDI